MIKSTIEDIKYLKLCLGLFRKKKADNINKIRTMLIGIISTVKIFFNKNKSINFNIINSGDKN